MKVNVGTLDRALRIGAGALFIGLAANSVVGLWGYFGIVPMLTGLFRFCPAYTLLGMNTCSIDKS